jgi:hypothetical protein
MEATPFDGALSDADVFVNGGDGAMLLDHSVCLSALSRLTFPDPLPQVVLFSGDLNYRISDSRASVISHVDSGRLDALLTKDQLLRELRANPAFRLRGFREAHIGFAPTYKYDRGTSDWDSSTKARAPAWCDRILWYEREKEDVRCVEYRRYEPDVSDHRPV